MTQTSNEKKYWIKRIKKSKLVEKVKFIIEYCADKIVLDVGAIGQDYNCTSENWLHGKIKKVAKLAHAVDINELGIDKLNRNGYHFFNYHDFNKNQIKYDVIIMADVIEHVDNPVEFINDYAKHLNDNGIILLTTPNCNRARIFFSILFFNEYGLNLEHTMWFCPKTLLEIINRSELIIEDFFWLKEYNSFKDIRIGKVFLILIERLLSFFRSNYNPNIMIILSQTSL